MTEKIAVLCGGDGAEREVSLRSGAAVRDALREAGMNAEAIDLTSLEQVSELKDSGFDCAFIAMHGDWGEDGELQSRLDALGIPYTGSGPAACARAMDKWQARECFKQAGLNVPRGLKNSGFETALERLGSSVVVKPCSGGSTVGVSILKSGDMTPENFAQAVRLSRESYDSDVLIEEYIEGRELTAAVWERDGRTEALPLIEIAPHSGFYDYKNKYTAGATEYLVPAPLAPDIAAKISEAAVKAHNALGCFAYSRTDFRLTPEGVPFALETNTAPGMTATSLVPKAAGAVGVSMPEFVREIVALAHRRPR